MEVSEAGGPTVDPRLQPAPQDQLYVAGGGRLSIWEDPILPAPRRALHAGPAPHALFPFSASGKGLFSRAAESRRPGGTRGLQETRAPCDRLYQKGRGRALQAAPEEGCANS